MQGSITVLTTTHFVRSGPSIRLLQKTLFSFTEAFGPRNTRHLISYDTPKRCSDTHLQYFKNLQSLRDRFGHVEVSTVSRLGLRGSFAHLIAQVDTPYLIFLEHDWIFLEKIAIEQLVYVFDK